MLAGKKSNLLNKFKVSNNPMYKYLFKVNNEDTRTIALGIIWVSFLFTLNRYLQTEREIKMISTATIFCYYC